MSDLEKLIRRHNDSLASSFASKAFELEFFQSNHEALFLEQLSLDWDGAVINPGAWTHTSLALADRLSGLALPFVEVHISNLAKREAFRQHSYAAPHALGVCFGFGLPSYLCALTGLYAHFSSKPKRS